MWGKIVVVGISAVLAIATELWFPINEADPLAVRQKHFWAAILFIFSVVLGIPIEGTLEMQAKLAEMNATLTAHEQQMQAEAKFQELYSLYNSNFSNGQPVLKGWADELLSYLQDNWKQGLMPLPRELASTQIGKVYPYARHSVIATNVGDTSFYFADETYIKANTAARDRGVPVIRFYIYGKEYKNRIVLRDGRHPNDINDFYKEVKELHTALGSLYSAVIDVDRVKLVGASYRDLLILDNKFLAETLETPQWEQIRAQASENDDRLKEARQYLRSIRAAVQENYTVQMNPEDVKRYFKTNGDKSADILFNKLIIEVIGQ